MRSKISAPFIVDFNVTKKCNLNCPFCYANTDEVHANYGEMDLQTIDDIFSQFDQLHIPLIRLTGGEPFLREDIVDILKLTLKYDFSICINSNGTQMSDHVCEQLTKQTNLISLAISLDSFRKDVHNTIRGSDMAYDSTLANLRKLLLLIPSHILSVTYTMTSLNCSVELISETIEYCRRTGIEKISFQYLAPVGRGMENFGMCASDEAWVAVFSYITKCKERYDDITIMVNPMNEAPAFWEFFYPLKQLGMLHKLTEVWGQNPQESLCGEISCSAGFFTTAIASNGDVYPCELMMDFKELCVGNITKEKFADIWDNAHMLKRLRSIRREHLTGKCGTCTVEFCGAGCRAVAYSANKNILDSDFRCPAGNLNEE